ncbi:SIS domain-containing protein, partial [Xanthomonas sp. SHU 199]
MALPSETETLMFREAAEAAAVVAAQFERNHATVSALAASLRAAPPPFVVTCARGSSDHAATYAKYLFETQLGVVTASASPSVGSVYEAPLQLRGALYLVISQSGKSPDLLRNAQAAKDAGARVVALVNVEDSPLAQLADTVIPLGAGPEKSVAATKSYLASLAAILQLGAHWKNDPALLGALQELPQALRAAWQADWRSLTDGLVEAHNLFVLDRGLGLAAAQEAALKFKETCGLHAEAYSSAEVKHGPMALVGPGFPVLAFDQPDEAGEGTRRLAEEFRGRGAQVWLASAGGDL